MSQHVDFTATRIFKHTNVSYEHVLENLFKSIGREADNQSSGLVAPSTESFNAESYTALVKSKLGPHGFMIFKKFDHGWWTNIVKEDGQQILKTYRIILGNPLIAITMLKHDTRAGLFVPVELLVREVLAAGQDEIVTEVSYIVPSSLIAPKELKPKEELKAAVKILDEKLAKLVDDICVS